MWTASLFEMLLYPVELAVGGELGLVGGQGGSVLPYAYHHHSTDIPMVMMLTRVPVDSYDCRETQVPVDPLDCHTF